MKASKIRLQQLVFGSALLSLIFIAGCKKEESASTDDFSVTAAEIGQAEDVSTDVDNMVGAAAKMGSGDNFQSPISDPSSTGVNSISSICGTVTKDSVNHTITIDFGSGCTGWGGVTRSGQILITYNGHYFDSGATWTTTFINYYVNNRHIEGTRIITNTGLNGAGNMTWSIDAQNMKVTRPDASWRSWNSLRMREMIAGFGDISWFNDKYKINGTATGTNSQGNSVSATLTDIVRENSCHYITSGTITVVPANQSLMTIDYGSGTCDDVATVTRNGHTKTIHLHW